MEKAANSLHDFGGFQALYDTHYPAPDRLRWKRSVWLNCWLPVPAAPDKEAWDLITALGAY